MSISAGLASGLDGHGRPSGPAFLPAWMGMDVRLGWPGFLAWKGMNINLGQPGFWLGWTWMSIWVSLASRPGWTRISVFAGSAGDLEKFVDADKHNIR